MPLVYYREQGTGHPLIFLHGFCDSHELWKDFIQPFTRTYRVITPDLPGFGKSERLPLPFSIDQVADRLAEWILGLKLERSLVVGHSLGGYVALALLEKHAKLLAGIALFHSTPYADTPERRQVRNKVITFVEENGVAPFVETFVPGLYANKSHPKIPSTRLRAGKTAVESLVGYAAAMRDRPDRSDLVAQTNLPVLAIGGVNDTLIPIADLQRLKAKAPKLHVFELEEAGHMGMHEAKKQAQNILSSYALEVWPIYGT